MLGRGKRTGFDSDEDLGEKSNKTNVVKLPSGYTALKNLKSGKNYDIYGVVKYFSRPAPNKKNNGYSMCVAVTDQSLENKEKLVCMFFGKTIQDFPPVEEVGDIIRLHRLEVSTFNGAPQGKAGFGFSAVIFPRIGGKPRSLKPFTVKDQDNEIVQKLRQWSSDLEKIDAAVSPSFKLNQCKIDEYFNLVCKVIHCRVIEVHTCMLFTVTDGTCVNRDMFQRVGGYATDILVFDDHYLPAKQVKLGDFIKLFNLHSAPYHVEKDIAKRVVSQYSSPTIDLCLHRGTKFGRGFKVLQSNSSEEKEINSRIEKLPEATIEQIRNFAHSTDDISCLPTKRSRHSSCRKLTPTKQLLAQPPESSVDSEIGTYDLDLSMGSSHTAFQPVSVQAVNQENDCYFTLPCDDFQTNHAHKPYCSIAELKNEQPEEEVKVMCRIGSCQSFNLRDLVVLFCPTCRFVSYMFPRLTSLATQSQILSKRSVRECQDLLVNTLKNGETVYNLLSENYTLNNESKDKTSEQESESHGGDKYTCDGEIEIGTQKNRPMIAQIAPSAIIPDFNNIRSCYWMVSVKPADVICAMPFYFCPQCVTEKSILVYSLLLQLTLRDDTGEVDAFMWGNTADYFCDGLNVPTCCANPEAVKHLEESLQQLLDRQIIFTIQPHQQSQTIYEITDSNIRMNARAVLNLT